MSDKKKKKNKKTTPYGIKDKKTRKAIEKAEAEKKAVIEKTKAVFEYNQEQGIPNDNLPQGRGISQIYDFNSAEVGVNFYFENVDDKNIIIIEPVGREFVDATGSEVVDPRYVENYFNNTTVEKVEEACEIRYQYWKRFIKGLGAALSKIQATVLIIMFMMAIVLYFTYSTHNTINALDKTISSMQSTLSQVYTYVSTPPTTTLNPTNTITSPIIPTQTTTSITQTIPP